MSEREELDPENAGRRVVKPPSDTTREPLGEIGNRRAPKRTRQDQPEEVIKRPRYVELAIQEHVPHKDIYRDEEEDITTVSEYVEDIFHYLYKLQADFMVPNNYMDNQPDLQWTVRGVLVNWLSQVHSKFRLLEETLYLGVNIMDRYLALKKVSLADLQLVGTAALYIAAKNEEVYSPGIDNYSYVSKSTNAEMVDMEFKILKALDYRFTYPNPLNFLRRISRADDSEVAHRTLAKYVMEISIYEEQLLSFRPSDIAAAAMLIGREVAGAPVAWDDVPELVYYSGGLTAQALQPIVEIMLGYMAGPVSHSFFYKKYSTVGLLKASIRCRNWAKEQLADDEDHQD